MNEGALQTLGILILLLPAGAAALCGALGPRVLRGSTHWLSIAGVGGAFVCAAMMFAQVWGAEGHAVAHPVVYDWFSGVAGQWFKVEFWIDPLTVVMLTMVTFIATWVVVYSKEYMRHDGHPERGYERFFGFLALFVFSMCALVLGGNFLLLYLGWELVGLCSYLLIGFYYGKPSAAAAAKKAFLVNRIGDFGFGLGVLLVFFTFGVLDYHSVFEMARLAREGGPENLAALADMMNIAPDAAVAQANVIVSRLPWIALLLFCGAVGKSAQFPLYVWLPDAMEGPSPVSALIHAATMVTAGVYMVVRCGIIFTASPTVMTIVAVVGAGTAMFAATMALVQTDMKRILAYSTISQLGYMFLGVGCFAASSAIFHLFTHAFFKACLFLAAGSVMHAMGGIIDVRRFGGLRKIMPWTFMTTLIASAALAGFPLLAGFWSKDEIVHAAMVEHPVLGVLALVTALLTAFYTFRMVFLAFFGEERVPEGVHAHEAGGWIITPLVILAVGALSAGYVGVHVKAGGFLGFLEPHGAIHHFLDPVVEPFQMARGGAAEAGHAAALHAEGVGHEAGPAMVAAGHAAAEAGASHAAHGEAGAAEHEGGYLWMYVSSVIAIVGIFAAWVLYLKRPWAAQLMQSNFPEAHRVLYNKYYVDEAYDAAIVRPLRQGGVMCFRIDQYVIDGLIWFITAIPRGLGFVFRSTQGGALQGYGLTMVAGLAIILAVVLLT